MRPLRRPSAIIEQIDKITAENGTNLSNALINTKEEIDKYNKRFREKPFTGLIPSIPETISSPGRIISTAQFSSMGTGGGEFLSNIADATLPDERIITPFIVNLEQATISGNAKLNTYEVYTDSEFSILSISSSSRMAPFSESKE